jgi:thiol-disulfide isomerase/thioredoxin
MKKFKFLIAVLVLLNSVTRAQKSASVNYTVYIFLAENCPVSQSYTLKLKELYTEYKSEKVDFIGIFANHNSTKKSMEDFKIKYASPFKVEKDKDGKKRSHFEATVTPEVFIEGSNKSIVYSGRIDDSFYDLGKKRNEITSNDLEDVLKNIMAGSVNGTVKTQAIGSLILPRKNG